MDAVIVKIILMVVATFSFVAIIMPFIKNLAVQIGAVDIPRTRHIHTKPMPKMGGVGIFLGFLLGYMIFGETSVQMNSILIGGFILNKGLELFEHIAKKKKAFHINKII